MQSIKKDESCNGELGPPSKRRKDPGVRVIGGRIYDSENGKTCHQCRQKTIDYMASCKSTAGSKSCTQKYCAKCLLNRYGEIALDVVQLNDWRCPRCRGDCNCSICLKKQGKTPTGILTPTAKATGFSSVADLLKKCANGDVKILAKRTYVAEASAKNALQSQVGNNVTNCSDENANNSEHKEGNANKKKRKLIPSVNRGAITPVFKALLVASNKKKAEKSKGKEKRVGSDRSRKKLTAEGDKNDLTGAGKKKSSQPEVGHEVPSKAEKIKNIKDYMTSSCSNSSHEQCNDKEIEKKRNKKKKSRGLDNNVQNMEAITEAGSKLSLRKENKNPKDHATRDNRKRKKIGLSQSSVEEEDIDLPHGAPLVNVSGMDLPTEAVGPALQLVEFCSAFKTVLGIRKGDVEAMLRELTKGRGRLARKGANSALIQFQAKLLALIVHGSLEMCNAVSLSSGDDKSSWLHVLKSHLAERSTVFIGLPTNKKIAEDCDLNKETDDDDQMLDTVEEVSHISELQSTIFTMSETLKRDLVMIRDGIEGGADGYENLGMYHKLQLLIMLCDDSLDTECMRTFIDSVHQEYWEAQKGNREEVLAAKKEEKVAKQKMRVAEVARMLASANVSIGQLCPEEKATLSSEVKAEADKAVAASLLVKEAVSRLNKSRNDAVRTDPVVWAPDGRAMYRLKGVNDLKSIVLQDVVGFDVPERDRWFIYSEEEEAVLSKFLQKRAMQSRKKMRTFEEEKENLVPV